MDTDDKKITDETSTSADDTSFEDDIDLSSLGLSDDEIETLEKEMESKKKDEPPKPSRAEQRIKELVKQKNEAKASGVTKDDIKNIVSETLKSHEEAKAKAEQEKAQQEKFSEELSTLEKKYDGKDGMPVFDRKAVIKYGYEHQIYDPEVAYRAMHFDKIVELKASGLIKEKPSFTTNGGQTDKTKQDVKYSLGDGSLRSAIAERLKKKE
jgi:hypothetical protein